MSEVLIPCVACRGTGQIGVNPCPACSGAGEVDAFAKWGVTEAHSIAMLRLIADIGDKVKDLKEKVDEIKEVVDAL